jgi:hypothetical protein
MSITWVDHRRAWELQKQYMELAYHQARHRLMRVIILTFKKIRVAAPEAKFGTIPFSPFFDF